MLSVPQDGSQKLKLPVCALLLRCQTRICGWDLTLTRRCIGGLYDATIVYIRRDLWVVGSIDPFRGSPPNAWKLAGTGRDAAWRISSPVDVVHSPECTCHRLKAGTIGSVRQRHISRPFGSCIAPRGSDVSVMPRMLCMPQLLSSTYMRTLMNYWRAIQSASKKLDD